MYVVVQAMENFQVRMVTKNDTCIRETFFSSRQKIVQHVNTFAIFVLLLNYSSINIFHEEIYHREIRRCVHFSYVNLFQIQYIGNDTQYHINQSTYPMETLILNWHLLKDSYRPQSWRVCSVFETLVVPR